jgi:superfamily II DNA or RNA helicase
VAGGHKTLLFADSPGNLELLGRELDRRGIDNLVFHGEIPIGKRTKAFKERFRRGDCPVMLASFGVTRRGHNIPEADRVILFNRLWSAREEAQSIARLLRPQQTREVLVERIHIKGSIDEYQAQMCAHKSDAARAGLDYGSPQMADAAYEHLETILGRFCEQLAKLRGCQRHDLRKSLQAA